MAQDVGTHLRAEALCSPKAARPRTAVEYPEFPRFPTSACLFRDTTKALPRQRTGARTASIEAGGPHNAKTTAESCLGTQHASITTKLKGPNSAGERQRAVTARQYYVPLCLLSRSRMMVAQSSNAYTGSAAVGEPNASKPAARRPLEIASGKMRREDQR
jgi:hypothetical protein